MDNAALTLNTLADNDTTQRSQLNKQSGVHEPLDIFNSSPFGQHKHE